MKMKKASAQMAQDVMNVVVVDGKLFASTTFATEWMSVFMAILLYRAETATRMAKGKIATEKP